MIDSFREFLRLLRYAQATASVRYQLWALEQARSGLAKSYDAYDKARAAILIHDLPLEDTDRPAFNQLRKDNCA